MAAPYAQLDEKEKQSDRDVAMRWLHMMDEEILSNLSEIKRLHAIKAFNAHAEERWLSTRAQNICRMGPKVGPAGIRRPPILTAEDLASYSEAEVDMWVNCGKKTKKEFKDLLESFGLTFKKQEGYNE
jgi:hypothetical protein